MNSIGLVGFPRSGKDAAAKHLAEHHGYTRIAFGDGVKSLLLAIDPIYKDSLEFLEICKNSKIKDTREKLQNLGEVLRKYDPDFWVKTALEKIEALPEGASVVVTDVRYQNEFDLVKQLGGELVGIKRPGHGAVNDHVSEQNTATLLQSADRIVYNDGTIQMLAQSVLGGYRVQG